jgi:hypothetical protein
MSTETVTTDADRRVAPAPGLPGPHPRERVDPANDLVVRLWLRGVLDPEALGTAWRDVLDRHAVLRTLTPADPDATAPVLEAPAVARVRRRPVRPEEVEEAVAAALARPAALATEGPARATLLRVGPEEHVLVLAVHRSAIDDRSVRPLLADLASAYSARRAGGIPVFAPAAGVVEWFASRNGSAGPRPARPPTERRGRWITVDRALAGGAAEALAALRTSHGACPLAAVIAATVVVEDGAPLDAEEARRDGGFEGAVGPFATVVRIACRPGGTGTDVLGRALDATRSARPATEPARTLVRYEPGGEPPPLDGLVVERGPAPAGPSGYDRVVTLVEGPDGVAVRLAVDAASGDAAGAAARVRRVAEALEQLLRDPAAPLV